MRTKYDQIGKGYSVKRCTDPKLAKQISTEFQGATRIINIGAGTGSYESKDWDLIAVEPSSEMISQRPPEAHPVEQAYAESLPFDDKSFSHAMTVLSMHHWQNRTKAFAEISRVTTNKFVAVTWLPEAGPFWLTRDYFPEFFDYDKRIFPDVKEFENSFDDIEVKPLLIPEDCQDGFLACYWKRPQAYLNSDVRAAISSFSNIKNIESRLITLKDDIESGKWYDTNADLLNQEYIDAGYRIITATLTQ